MAQRKRIHVSAYFAHKRRKASTIAVGIICLALLMAGLALAAPSYHHQMVALPFSVGIWLNTSLWRLRVYSSCDAEAIFLLQDGDPTKSGDLLQNMLCKYVTKTLSGMSLGNAAEELCGPHALSLLSFGAPCQTITSIGLASNVVIGLLFTAAVLDLTAMTLAAIFSKSVPTERMRRSVLASTFFATMVVTIGAIVFPAIGVMVNDTTFNMWGTDPLFQAFKSSTSLSVGYFTLVFAGVTHGVAAMTVAKVLKSDFTAGTDEQYALFYRRHRAHARADNDDELKYMVSVGDSVLGDEDMFIENEILDDEVAKREIQRVFDKELRLAAQ